MVSIHLVLYFTKEAPRVLEISLSGDNLTIPELKMKVHDIIVDFIHRPENSDLGMNLEDQEFNEYQQGLEKALIARCRLVKDHEIETSEITLEERLLDEIKQKLNVEIKDITGEFDEVSKEKSIMGGMKIA